MKPVKMPASKTLQLTKEEVKAANTIAGFSKDDKDKIASVLQKYCRTTMAFIRLAINSQPTREWCRKNNEQRWQNDLKKLGKFEAFECEFKIPKKLNVFDLLAGSLLINESLREDKVKNQVVILYIAMEMFNSIHATCSITKMTVDMLATKEKEIKPMIQNLERIASIHGCPGYLLYSWFNQKVGEFFLEKKQRAKAAGALHLGYQYLLTAAKLEKECSAELHNTTYGNLPLFLQSIDDALDKDTSQPPLPPFLSMLTRYENRFAIFVTDIKLAAQTRSLSIAEDWVASAMITKPKG